MNELAGTDDTDSYRAIIRYTIEDGDVKTCNRKSPIARDDYDDETDQDLSTPHYCIRKL